MDNTEWIIASIGTAVLMTVVGIIVIQRMLRGKRYCLALKEERTISQELITLAYTLTVLGIVFGSDRLIGYSFIGAGIILSIFIMIETKKEDRKILAKN